METSKKLVAVNLYRSVEGCGREYVGSYPTWEAAAEAARRGDTCQHLPGLTLEAAEILGLSCPAIDTAAAGGAEDEDGRDWVSTDHIGVPVMAAADEETDEDADEVMTATITLVHPQYPDVFDACLWGMRVNDDTGRDITQTVDVSVGTGMRATYREIADLAEKAREILVNRGYGVGEIAYAAK